MRRTPTLLALASALAVALPTSLSASAQPHPEPLDHAPVEVSDLVVDAARDAAEQRHPGVRLSSGDGAPSERMIARSLDRAAEGLVADGAVGVTARLDSADVDWRGSAGVREVDRRAPAQPHDRFRVASITKPMVATLVMQEVEAGTLALDTQVNDLVPGLFPEQPDVTVEHLLSHRSGAQTGTDALLQSRIEDLTDWEQFVDAIGQEYTDAEQLAVVNALPWLFEPGTSFSYSNAGYVALGVLLEEVTGEDLEDLLEERVFEPARMRHSSYPDEPGTRGPFLVGAAWTGEEDEDGLGWVSLDGFDPTLASAAGAAVSTTKDLNRFTEALVTGELVGSELVADMVTPRTQGSLQYGLGIYRVSDPCTPAGEPLEWLYGHDGGLFGTVSIALTSADGTRQLSLGITGRDLTQPVLSYAVDELLVPMLLASC